MTSQTPHGLCDKSFNDLPVIYPAGSMDVLSLIIYCTKGFGY